MPPRGSSASPGRRQQQTAAVESAQAREPPPPPPRGGGGGGGKRPSREEEAAAPRTLARPRPSLPCSPRQGERPGTRSPSPPPTAQRFSRQAGRQAGTSIEPPLAQPPLVCQGWRCTTRPFLASEALRLTQPRGQTKNLKVAQNNGRGSSTPDPTQRGTLVTTRVKERQPPTL